MLAAVGNNSVESENDDIKPAQVAFGKIKSLVLDNGW